MNSKQILNYFAVSESFSCTLFNHVISMNKMHTIKYQNLLRLCPNHPPELPLIPRWFQHTFCMTQMLETLPYNYQSAQKPLFTAL